jgi:hypothetical protein
VVAAKCHEHGKSDHAARALIQVFTLPDITEAVPGDNFLQLIREVSRILNL